MRKQITALAILASASTVHAYFPEAYWRFGDVRPIVTTRLDPIVNRGQIGTHVHSIAGASRFSKEYDPDDLMKSKCTTIPVQPDKSNYWMPPLYHQDQTTHELTLIPSYYNIYYQQRPGEKNEPIRAFPKGLVVVAGDTNRHTFNGSSFADQAVSYTCQDFDQSHTGDPAWDDRPNLLFNHTCPSGLRAQVYFPSCWDGKNLDSEDHKSHMAYPLQNYNGGDCPEDHPVHLISLFIEMVASVDKFDYWGPETWVLANGDNVGYALHADFQNGWDVDLLQWAIGNCTDISGVVERCPQLNATVDQAAADACVLETEIVDEEVGLKNPIATLPGCNPVWDGSGSKPPCPNPPKDDPKLIPAQPPLPSGWTEVGCIAEGTTGRALTGATMTSSNMTKAVCAGFCAASGFKLSGSEFGDECYCDNDVRNGASVEPVTWSKCTTHCAADDNEICGGPDHLTLLRRDS